MRTSFVANLKRSGIGEKLRQAICKYVAQELVRCAQEIDHLNALAIERKQQNCAAEQCEMSLRQIGKSSGLVESAEILRLRAYQIRVDAGLETEMPSNTKVL